MGFIEELKKSLNYLDDMPVDTESARKFFEMYTNYKGMVGKRALYKCGRGEARVVKIVEVNTAFIRVQYPYYGKDYTGVINTCTNYNSLICGDDRLEIS